MMLFLDRFSRDNGWVLGVRHTAQRQFLNEEGFDAIALMAPDKLVDVTIRGLQREEEKIYPGLAKVFKISWFEACHLEL